MKKQPYVVLALGALAGAASAQSSVTLYGTIDVAARYVKADGQPRRLSEATDALNSNQLALRGIEDLGSGLKAGFTLLSGIAPDTGSTSATNSEPTTSAPRGTSASRSCWGRSIARSCATYSRTSPRSAPSYLSDKATSISATTEAR